MLPEKSQPMSGSKMETGENGFFFSCYLSARTDISTQGVSAESNLTAGKISVTRWSDNKDKRFRHVNPSHEMGIN